MATPAARAPSLMDASTVRTVLYRDLYRGTSIWNKRRKSDTWGQRTCRPRPEGEWIRADVPHLRIVSDQDWNAAHQRIRAVRKLYLASAMLCTRPPSQLRSQYLLSGRARCAWCGASMTVRIGTHGQKRQPFYICASYDRRGRTVCANGLRLPMAAADDAVLETLLDYMLDPSVVEGAIADAVAQLHPALETLGTQRAALEAAIRKLEREQARFVEAIAVAGQVDALAQGLRDSERQRTRLKTELTVLDNAEQLATFDVGQIEGAIRTRLGGCRELLRRHTPIARQIVAQLVHERIAWTPRKEERLYEFVGKMTLERVLTGRVSTMG